MKIVIFFFRASPISSLLFSPRSPFSADGSATLSILIRVGAISLSPLFFFGPGKKAPSSFMLKRKVTVLFRQRRRSALFFRPPSCALRTDSLPFSFSPFFDIKHKRKGFHPSHTEPFPLSLLSEAHLLLSLPFICNLSSHVFPKCYGIDTRCLWDRDNHARFRLTFTSP